MLVSEECINKYMCSMSPLLSNQSRRQYKDCFGRWNTDHVQSKKITFIFHQLVILLQYSCRGPDFKSIK